MPGDQTPGGGPIIRIPETKFKKPVSFEEFKKLKVGDKFWTVPSLSFTRGAYTVIGPLVIFSINTTKNVTKVEFAKEGQDQPFNPVDLKNLLKDHEVFLSESDAEQELNRRLSSN